MKISRGTIVHVNGIPAQIQEDVEAWTSPPNQPSFYVRMTEERARVIMDVMNIKRSEDDDAGLAAQQALRHEIEELYPYFKDQYRYIPYYNSGPEESGVTNAVGEVSEGSFGGNSVSVIELEDCPTCDGTGEVHSHSPICWDCGKDTPRGKVTPEKAASIREQDARIRKAFPERTGDYV